MSLRHSGTLRHMVEINKRMKLAHCGEKYNSGGVPIRHAGTNPASVGWWTG